jgi:hypothetical protein
LNLKHATREDIGETCVADHIPAGGINGHVRVHPVLRRLDWEMRGAESHVKHERFVVRVDLESIVYEIQAVIANGIRLVELTWSIDVIGDFAVRGNQSVGICIPRILAMIHTVHIAPDLLKAS